MTITDWHKTRCSGGCPSIWWRTSL